MSDIKISMCMIAKNEAENIEACFSSFWDEVDEVVLVDTGSTDTTVRTAKSFAWKRDEADKLKIGQYDWNDSFADARNYADSLATGTHRSWIDLDDVVAPGSLTHLRELAEQSADDVAMFYAVYAYASDNHGNCVCELWRERLVRADAGCEWIGRVHECQIGRGTFARADPTRVRWIHGRDHSDLTLRDRNEKILRRWFEDEPNDPRVCSYLAFELMGSRVDMEHEGRRLTAPDRKKIEESLHYFERFLQMGGQPPDTRAQAVRRYAQALLTLGQLDRAEAVSLPMVAECPQWPDTLLTLAEVAHQRGQWTNALEHAKQVIDKGKPDTLLIINPEDYTLRPHMLMASALASMGRLEEACEITRQVVGVSPDFMAAQAQLAEWLGALTRNQAATTWANSAQLLYENDEPEKALVLLDTAPFFCRDQPAIVAARVKVVQALKEPYVAEPVTDSPRGQFLLRQLHGQEAELRATPAEEIHDERELVAA